MLRKILIRFPQNLLSHQRLYRASLASALQYHSTSLVDQPQAEQLQQARMACQLVRRGLCNDSPGSYRPVDLQRVQVEPHGLFRHHSQVLPEPDQHEDKSLFLGRGVVPACDHVGQKDERDVAPKLSYAVSVLREWINEIMKEATTELFLYRSGQPLVLPQFAQKHRRKKFEEFTCDMTTS